MASEAASGGAAVVDIAASDAATTEAATSDQAAIDVAPTVAPALWIRPGGLSRFYA